MYKIFNLKRKISEKYNDIYSVAIQFDNHSPQTLIFEGQNSKQDLLNKIYELLLVSDEFKKPEAVENFKKRTGFDIVNEKVIRKPSAKFGG